MQTETKQQIDLGGEGLDEQDICLLEIDLEDLEHCLRKEQYYWMISIQATRKLRQLNVTEMSRAVETREERRAQEFISLTISSCTEEQE